MAGPGAKPDRAPNVNGDFLLRGIYEETWTGKRVPYSHQTFNNVRRRNHALNSISIISSTNTLSLRWLTLFLPKNKCDHFPTQFMAHFSDLHNSSSCVNKLLG